MATDRDRARWALRDDRKLSKIAKLVWYTLDTRGEDPWPTIGTIAADCGTGTTRNTVKRGLAELEAAGWVRVIQRTTQDGGATSHRYVLESPAQEGVGPSQTRGVGPLRTGGGSIADPKDQREDQQVEDQREPMSPAAAGEIEKDHLEKITGWIIAARIGYELGIIASPEDSAGIAYLWRTFSKQANGKRRGDVEFARYLAKACLGARDQVRELVDLELTGELHDYGLDDAEPLLKEIRGSVQPLPRPQYRRCGQITEAARACAKPGMTAREATEAGISLHKEGQP